MLGPYEIVSPLGSGGMGEVYRATDRRLGRLVAIKILHVGTHASASTLPLIEREARAAAANNHPHICTLYRRRATRRPGIPGHGVARGSNAG